MAKLQWMKLLGEAMERNPNAKIFSVATIDGDVPRVRTMAYRTTFAESTSQPQLIATTDVRTPKVTQLYSSGQFAEIAWWLEETGEQFRMTVKTYVLPHPQHPLHARFPFDRLAQPSRSSATEWEKSRIDIFDNYMGSATRASFCRPTPGSILPGGYESAKEWPESLPRSNEVEEGSKEAIQVAEALSRFSLTVFVPFKVERVELNTAPHRRTSWIWEEAEQIWKESILVP
ncbi:hypothetical protein DL93DRAFT_38800 [Clavulina sp. PMI_390]|nr:hypothetical protein DL93DRAFT_38800 [Clavulina sp. PMI_390]